MTEPKLAEDLRALREQLATISASVQASARLINAIGATLDKMLAAPIEQLRSEPPAGGGLSLKALIVYLGDAQAADLFQVKQRTVEAWRRGERTPRPAKARQIVNLARGRLNMADVYGLTSQPTEATQ